MNIYKRTFEARAHPKGSTIRDVLNLSSLTSEYKPSHKYLVKWGREMQRTFKTKGEAEMFIRIIKEEQQ